MSRFILYFILVLLLGSCESRRQPDQKTETAETSEKTNNTAAIPAPTKPARPAATQKPDSLFMIVPGQRIGQINLGETAEMVNSKLGQPDSGDAAMGKALTFWINPDEKKVRQYVAVYFVRSSDGAPEAMRAQQIQVSSPAFKTQHGLGTGSKLSNIRGKYKLQAMAYYTNEKRKQVYIYDDVNQGIAFEVTTPDSLCTAITIHKAGESITDTYLPLHPDMTRLKE